MNRMIKRKKNFKQIFCYIVNVFIVTFDPFYVSL